jgi:hypothetical protein
MQSAVAEGETKIRRIAELCTLALFYAEPTTWFARASSTDANLDCLVNFAQRCSAGAVFVHCSSTYGLFCMHGAVSWLPTYDRSLAAAAATAAMNAVLSGHI